MGIKPRKERAFEEKKDYNNITSKFYHEDKLGVVVQTWKPSTREAETRDSGAPEQPGLYMEIHRLGQHSETLFKKTKKNMATKLLKNRWIVQFVHGIRKRELPPNCD